MSTLFLKKYVAIGDSRYYNGVRKGGGYMELARNFSSRLKDYMNSHDLSFRDMERLTGIPAQTINRYVLGQRTPKIDVLHDIASHLGVSDRWLMGLDDESPAIPEDDKALLEEVSANPELMNLLRILKQIEPDRLAALAKLVEPML